MARSITVQAWVEGGSPEPSLEVTLAETEHGGPHGLYLLSVHDIGSGDLVLDGVQFDLDSLHQLLGFAVEADEITHSLR